MGARSSRVAALEAMTPLGQDEMMEEPNEAESARKRQLYAHLHSAAVPEKRHSGGGFFAFRAFGSGRGKERDDKAKAPQQNLIEQIYNEDFDTIDHTQALRFPPYVTRQLRDAVRDEAERRCMEKEKTMARCLQDKMWTAWKCQKQRDAYYHCVMDEEERNTRRDPNDDNFVDLLTTYRWKYNLGVFNGEIVGRNNLMRHIWKEHFPDRDLPYTWVNKDKAYPPKKYQTRTKPMIRIFADETVMTTMEIFELQGKLVASDDQGTTVAALGVGVMSAQRQPHEDQTVVDPISGGDDVADDGTELGTLVQDKRQAKRCTLCMGTLHVEGNCKSYGHPLLVLRRRPRHVAHAHDDVDKENTTKVAGPHVSQSECVAAVHTVDDTEVHCDGSGDVDESPTTELLEEWLRRHPRVMSLETLYTNTPTHMAGPDAATRQAKDEEGTIRLGGRKRERSPSSNDVMESSSYVDYDLIGVVRDYVHFAAKPTRVLGHTS